MTLRRFVNLRALVLSVESAISRVHHFIAPSRTFGVHWEKGVPLQHVAIHLDIINIKGNNAFPSSGDASIPY
jgi:hypothetical protein